MLRPSFYLDSCPPIDTEIPNGIFCRLVNSQTPTANDFIPRILEDSRFSNNCQACGVSVHNSVESSKKARDRHPGFRNKFIAQATLQESHGRIAHTPSKNSDGHCTRWIYEGIEPHTFFNVVA